MKEPTRDFLAVELLTLLAIVLSSIVLVGVLSQLGISGRILYVGLFLYSCRWVWWAVRHCRRHPRLHGVAGRLLGWIAGMLCLIGLAVALLSFTNGMIPLGIAGLLLAVGGVGLIAWMSKALTSVAGGSESQTPSPSQPQHQDV